MNKADFWSNLILKDYLEVLAVLLSPIIAVWVGQILQTRKQNSERVYQNKFAVFAQILGNRHSKGYSEDFTIAMNQIPIVFHENEKVLNRLSKFIDVHTDLVSPRDLVSKRLDARLNDLVLAMAADLGYQNIDNNLMSDFFYAETLQYRYDASYLNDKATLNHGMQNNIPPDGSSEK